MGAGTRLIEQLCQVEDETHRSAALARRTDSTYYVCMYDMGHVDGMNLDVAERRTAARRRQSGLPASSASPLWLDSDLYWLAVEAWLSACPSRRVALRFTSRCLSFYCVHLSALLGFYCTVMYDNGARRA
jgi:hypothetical protein